MTPFFNSVASWVGWTRKWRSSNFDLGVLQEIGHEVTIDTSSFFGLEILAAAGGVFSSGYKIPLPLEKKRNTGRLGLKLTKLTYETNLYMMNWWLVQ